MFATHVIAYDKQPLKVACPYIKNNLFADNIKNQLCINLNLTDIIELIIGYRFVYVSFILSLDGL